MSQLAPIFELPDYEAWYQMISKGSGRSVVEFYAPWCRESQMMLIVMNQMRTEFPGIFFCRFNMDKIQYPVPQLDVTGVPSVLLFAPTGTEAVVVEHIKGFISADMFREKLNAFMSWQKPEMK